jgi:hypothetical protein
MCNCFYKANVFFTGLILNIICSIIEIVLIILCGIQYRYIDIQWAKINAYQNLCDFELSFCILYIFTCILGFIVFIKSLECKTMQKIYLIYAIITWIFSVVVCAICFISYPNIIKDNSNIDCQSINPKGILKNINKFDNIFYEVNKFLCSDDCMCSDEIISFQKCPDLIKTEAFKSVSNLNSNSDITIKEKFNEKFMSYWSKIEKKFDCVGICNTSYVSPNDNNIININKYLFSDYRNSIENMGCLYPLSLWLNKMIISFASLLIFNIVLSFICIYIGFAILFDKVYEGSNYPDFNYIQGIKGNNINQQEEIIKGSVSYNKSMEARVTSNNK